MVKRLTTTCVSLPERWVGIASLHQWGFAEKPGRPAPQPGFGYLQELANQHACKTSLRFFLKCPVGQSDGGYAVSDFRRSYEARGKHLNTFRQVAVMRVSQAGENPCWVVHGHHLITTSELNTACVPEGQGAGGDSLPGIIFLFTNLSKTGRIPVNLRGKACRRCVPWNRSRALHLEVGEMHQRWVNECCFQISYQFGEP